MDALPFRTRRRTYPGFYRSLNTKGIAADMSDKKQRTEEELGAVGGQEEVTLVATEAEIAELDQERKPKEQGAKPKRKGSKTPKASQPEKALEPDVAVDAVFRQLQGQVDAELQEQQSALKRLQRMKHLQDLAAERDAVKRQAEQLAAELGVPAHGYVQNPSTGLYDVSLRDKVNDWLVNGQTMPPGQTGHVSRGQMNAPAVHSGLSAPVPVPSGQGHSGLAGTWSALRQSAVTVTGSEAQGHGLSAQPWDAGAPESSQPYLGQQTERAMAANGATGGNKQVSYSYLERVAGLDKNALYFSNTGVNTGAGLRQANQQGLLPATLQPARAMAPMPPQGPPLVVPLGQHGVNGQMRQVAPPVLQQAPPEHGIMPPPAVERDQDGESTTSDSSKNSKKSVKKLKKKKIKSGFLDKPDTNVRSKVQVPHMAQSGLFMHKPTTFEKLSFECFVAGEARIIEMCSDPVEMLGRLKLLQRVCYWKAGGSAWVEVRSMYRAILRMIEDGEFGWMVPLFQFDAMMNIDYSLIQGFSTQSNQGKKRQHVSLDKNQDVWFCREFNRSECAETPPHYITYKGAEKLALHICARCWREKKEKQFHSENSSECPRA